MVISTKCIPTNLMLYLQDLENKSVPYLEEKDELKQMNNDIKVRTLFFKRKQKSGNLQLDQTRKKGASNEIR